MIIDFLNKFLNAFLNFDFAMSKKNKPDSRGFVYSTDPNFSFEQEQDETQQTLPPNQQKLRVRLDTKQRAGKAVTLVTGFVGNEQDLEDLGK